MFFQIKCNDGEFLYFSPLRASKYLDTSSLGDINDLQKIGLKLLGEGHSYGDDSDDDDN